MPNPFTLKVIADKENFCNRTKEIADLTGYAVRKANVVLFLPRKQAWLEEASFSFALQMDRASG